MFAKIINNIVEVYPYNPQVDYPLTSFPVGASYPAFNCYWVYPTTPNNPDPELYNPIVTPVFNGGRWEQAWDYELLPKPKAVPDWDGFNGAMLQDVAFNQTTGAVMGVVPSVALALPAALAQVLTNGVNAFGLVFNAFCEEGNVSVEQRSEWADIAESFNLPSNFVDVVRS